MSCKDTMEGDKKIKNYLKVGYFDNGNRKSCNANSDCNEYDICKGSKNEILDECNYLNQEEEMAVLETFGLMILHFCWLY